MIKGGLILEGGGMRGIYTAGVLDFFIDRDIYFSEVYGVSAGSANGSSYLSKQKGRAFHVNTDFLDNKEYASAYSLVTTGNFFGSEMCYDTIPNKLLPYDYETFKKYEGNFYAVATNCITGHPEYLKVRDMKKDIYKIKASCSLPLMAEMVYIDGVPYLDGGISDSIPIRQSIKSGNKLNVVVLTRDIDYRKKPNELLPVIKLKYKKYPELVKTIENRHIQYNRTLEYIKNQEEKGNIFCIRPSVELTVGRLEKNKGKLVAVYRQGYKDAKSRYEELIEYINS